MALDKIELDPVGPEQRRRPVQRRLGQRRLVQGVELSAGRLQLPPGVPVLHRQQVAPVRAVQRQHHGRKQRQRLGLPGEQGEDAQPQHGVAQRDQQGQPRTGTEDHAESGSRAQRHHHGHDGCVPGGEGENSQADRPDVSGGQGAGIRSRAQSMQNQSAERHARRVVGGVEPDLAPRQSLCRVQGHGTERNEQQHLRQPDECQRHGQRRLTESERLGVVPRADVQQVCGAESQQGAGRCQPPGLRHAVRGGDDGPGGAEQSQDAHGAGQHRDGRSASSAARGWSVSGGGCLRHNNSMCPATHHR